MHASFPQVAFWVIFPVAALIVLSGWTMILVSAAKKIRTGKRQEGNDPVASAPGEDPTPLQPDWNREDLLGSGGSNAVPFA
jgi:hypothetical protein